MDHDALTTTDENASQGAEDERLADRQLIEDLMDKIDGLESDLSSAVEVAVSRGAVEWAQLNYPGHPSLKPGSPQMDIAVAAGLSALTAELNEHRSAASAADRHLSGEGSDRGFSHMSADRPPSTIWKSISLTSTLNPRQPYRKNKSSY